MPQQNHVKWRSESGSDSSSTASKKLLGDHPERGDDFGDGGGGLSERAPTATTGRLTIKSQIDCHDCTDGIPTFDEKSPKNSEVVDPKYRTAQRRLMIAAFFVLIFMGIEFAAGVIANSLAILTDAAHMFSDLAAFLISIGALMLTRRSATEKLTFGWHRAEILGVLMSILLIWGLTGALIFEAVQRVQDPPEVNGPIVFGTATVGLVFNLIIMGVLQGSGHGHSHGGGGGGHGHGGHGHGGHGGHGHSHSHGSINAPPHKGSHGSDGSIEVIEKEEMNINVRAAWIHALGDVIQSIGVIAAGIVIWVKPEWSIADPICTFVFSVLVLFTTFQMLVDAVNILMAGTPKGVNPRAVEADLMTVAGVLAVHDLHIWNLTMGKPLASVHVVIDYHDPDQTLEEVRTLLSKKYHISHSTVQMERGTDSRVAALSMSPLSDRAPANRLHDSEIVRRLSEPGSPRPISLSQASLSHAPSASASASAAASHALQSNGHLSIVTQQ